MDANLWMLIAGILGAIGGYLFRKPATPPSPTVSGQPATPGGPASVTLTGPIAELLAPIVAVLEHPTFGPAIKPVVEGLVVWVRERFFPTKDGSALPFQGDPWAPPADTPKAAG